MLLSYQSCTNKNYYLYLTNNSFCVEFLFFLCRAPLGRKTAPGFLREETSKQSLTWTLQPCQWHFPSTCTAAESLPWITSIFFPSLLGFAEAETSSILLPASPHCPGHAVAPLWQLQPSPWHPPCLLSLPTCSGSAPQPVLLGPPNLSNNAGLGDLQRFLTQAIKCSPAQLTSRTSRGGTLLCNILKFQGQSPWTLAACVKTKL